MKVFLSWSGELSRTVAVILKDWLPSVVQALQPYISSEDIEKGARWTTDVARELEATRFGLVCVTRQNVTAPWLNFEAGALSKTLDAVRVSPFLIAMRPADLPAGHPLLQFQATTSDRDDVLRLVQTLNRHVGEGRLDDDRLTQTFDRWWGDLAAALRKAVEEQQASGAGRKIDPAAALEELVELTRSQQKMIVSLADEVRDEAFREMTASAKSSRDPAVEVHVYRDTGYGGIEAMAETAGGRLLRRKFADTGDLAQALNLAGLSSRRSARYAQRSKFVLPLSIASRVMS